MHNDSETAVNILRMFDNCNIYIDDLKKIFCSVEIGIIHNLYKDESIINIFDKEKGTEMITLTRKGKFLLFSSDNKKQIEAFSIILEENGYNTSYLGDYLKASNLDRSLTEIFSVEDYELFIHNLKELENSRTARRIMLRNNRNIG